MNNYHLVRTAHGPRIAYRLSASERARRQNELDDALKGFGRYMLILFAILLSLTVVGCYFAIKQDSQSGACIIQIYNDGTVTESGGC